MTPDPGTAARQAARDGALPAFMERIQWSAERLAAERERRLRTLLAVAKARSPWHGRRLAAVDGDGFREADLPALPVMTKTDLMAHFDEIVTDRALTLAAANAWVARIPETPLVGRYWAFASGGSSGLRGVFVYDQEGAITFSCMIGRWMLRTGGPPPGAGPAAMLWAAAEPTCPR